MDIDIDKLAEKHDCWEDGAYQFTSARLQAYTNEIIELCAIEAEKEFKHNSYHVADLIRNLKG